MCRYGIVHDAVPCYKSIIFNNAWHYFRKEYQKLWHLPIISVVAFLAGVWLFFGIQEPWFLVYASVYLCLGIISMLITNYIKQK